MPASAQLDASIQTREKILSTAARLFSTQGYETTVLSQVAREANVSKALVLWHFDSKEKLFQAALGRTLEPYFIDSDDLDGLDEPQQIERLIDQFYEFVQENVYSVRFVLGLILRGDQPPDDDVLKRIGELYRLFRNVLASVIQRGQENRRFRPDARPQLDASLIVAALAGILIEHFMSEETPKPAELVAYLKRTTFERLID
jgi:AcrR family transcriptional regulator